MSSADLDTFYELLGGLERLPGQGRRLEEYTGRSGWPQRGVYFFREPGEYRDRHPRTPRVVRVGTHAVSANAKSKLWSRLRAHRGSQDRRGNHRRSIFRGHVGAALLSRDQAEIGELPTWRIGSSAARSIRDSESAHERRVSAYLGQMSVLWVEVPDEPGPQSARAYIERNAIALLSNHLRPIDRPSDCWLGLYSPYPDIRSSGLWNLDHVHHQYDPGFLQALADFVARVTVR
jgi:hypothetical protein